LSTLVSGMLEKRPADRPTVEEFLDELALIEDEVFGSVNLAGPTLQSLMPSVPGSRRRMDSIVPGSTRQVVASLPSTSAWRDRQEASLSQRSSLAPTVASEGGLSSTKRKWLLALGLVSSPLVLWLLFRSPTAPAPSPNASTSAPHAVAPSIESAKVIAPATTFELTITSEPAQASVSEDGLVLGRTPLSLTIERASVAEKPRRFILRREGYAPYAVEQRDSEAPVQLSLNLVPTARAGVTPRRPRSAPAPALKEAPPKRGDAQGLDIRLRR
jgi:hypothetical protein